MVATPPDLRGYSKSSNFLGPALFVSAICAAVPVFWFGLVSLGDAWSTPEYSHGPLIPIVSAYLFLRDMRSIPSASVETRNRWLGVWVITFAMLLAMIGNLSRIPDIVTYALIIWIWGMILVSFGAHRGKHLWPGVLHLVFMLPLPNIIYWKLSIFLQGVSSEIGVSVIRLLDIPVFLDGNIIDLGIYKLQVAEACSGLRYLFPIMSFSYIFSLLYQGPKWHKAILLLSAAPITVLMNSFRIGVIGVLVDRYGIEQAEGFLHAFEGWVIFGACVGILFIMSIGLQKISRDKRSISEALDLDFSGIPLQISRIKSLILNRAAVGVLIIVAIFAGATLAIPRISQPQLGVERTPLALFPRSFDGWWGERRYLEPNIEAVLAADDYLNIGFIHNDGKLPVDLFIAYYDKLTEGGGIHSPEVCLPTGGWEMSEIKKRQLSIPTDTGNVEFVVNRAIIQKGLHRQLVYYWFDTRGRRLTGDYETKAYTIYDALVRGRTDGALVRVVTIIPPKVAEETADARLLEFLEDVVLDLPNYIPH